MANLAAETTPTVADLLEQLGDIPPHRVMMRPLPGTATEQDVIEIRARERRLCELVDVILVEKAAGYQESVLGLLIGSFLATFVR